MEKEQESKDQDIKMNLGIEDSKEWKKIDEDKENKITPDEQIPQSQQNQSNQKNISLNNQANASTSTPQPNSLRNQKALAMNRMRNSIKDTLFKGITKKVNPEGTNQDDPTQNNAQGNIGSQQLSLFGRSQRDQNSKEQQQQTIQSQNQNQQDKFLSPVQGNLFQIQQNLANSIEIEECPRIEFNFSGNSSNKYRTNESVINKILDDRQSPPQKNSSIINQTRIFEENYEILNEKLGEGCHGDVRKCIHKTSKQIYAVKMIRNGDTEIILSAITSFKIAKNLNHPSVIKPYELFINRETEKIYYVMEYCEYPSLQDYIENLWSLSPHKRDRYRKAQSQSKEQYDEESNSLDSQSNTDFEEVSSKVLRNHKKKSHKKKNKGQNEENKNKLINIQQQLGSSDNLQISQTKLFADEEGQESTSNKEKKKIQFQGVPPLQTQDQDFVKKILKEILIAVDYLHSEGICHRDLKPDNILVSSDQQKVKIIDFEISKQFKFFRQNRSGVLKTCEMWTRTGTQDFMSPEMFESTGYTEAVDIWAIGVIAYFLLTGKLPFDQEYISDKVEFIRNAQYNQEYLKDIDEIPKDFIRRMLKKEPTERLTAQEALSHPWFLVSSSIEPRNRSELNLNKSTMINLFYSPLDSDKTSNIEMIKFKDLSLIKGNQSTVLVKKDNLIDDELQQINNSYLNKIASQRNNNLTNTFNNGSGNNYSYSSKNSKSKLRTNKITSDFYDNMGQDMSTSPNMTESSTTIQQKKRSSKVHATEIGNTLQSNIRNTFVDQNDNYQFFKQTLLNEDNSLSVKQGESSCRVLKYQDQSAIPNSINYGQNSPQFCIQNKLESQNSSNSKTGDDEESEIDDSTLKRKKEFKMKIQQFKEQMSSGMSDRLFIHINQKSFKHPPVSQLRLRLLQEKALAKTNTSEKNVINPINMAESKNEYQKTQTNIYSQQNNGSQTTTANFVSQNQIINQQSNPHFNTSIQQNIQNVDFSSSGFNLNPSNNNINPPQLSTSNSSINFTLFQNNNHQQQFPFESVKLSPFPPQASTTTQTAQSQSHQPSFQQNLNAQHFIDSAEIELSNPRSRSNTNDILEKTETDDQLETRAKRLSEDFTSSSCVIQNPVRQQQMQREQNNVLSSQKNGSSYEGKVQKSSLFSMNQPGVSNGNINNGQSQDNNFSIVDNIKQLSIQEQLSLKPTKFVKEFLLSTGNLKVNENVDDATQKNKENPHDTSINQFFKKIESDDESVHNENEETVFKKTTSSNREHNKSNSDLCSIASQINVIDEIQAQKEKIANQKSDAILSSSGESYVSDEDD